MPHFITDKCIGCSVCEIKCPTNTIWGAAKGQYYIHPERCIDCSVCGIYCPVDAIHMDANKVELSTFGRQDLIWNIDELLGDKPKAPKKRAEDPTPPAGSAR